MDTVAVAALPSTSTLLEDAVGPLEPDTELSRALRRLRAVHGSGGVDTAADVMADGYVRTDGGNQIVAANEGARRVLGVDELVGHCLMDGGTSSTLGVDRACTSPLALSATATQRPTASVTLHVLTDGTVRHWLLRPQARTDIFRDLSLIHAANRAALGVFAHDLMSPLHDSSRVLSRLATHLDEQGRAQVTTLRLLLDKVRAVADDVHQLETVLAGDRPWRRTDLAALTAVVIRDVSSVDADLVAVDVEGVPMLLRRAIGNLVDNARRHTPPGTAVRVHVRPRQEVAELIVEDEGPGVPDAIRPILFEPLVRAGPLGQGGLGLGLSLVRRIAELHDGEAWLRDGECGGTAFGMTLPRARGD